jgi:hypothetical protein
MENSSNEYREEIPKTEAIPQQCSEKRDGYRDGKIPQALLAGDVSIGVSRSKLFPQLWTAMATAFGCRFEHELSA